MKRRTFIKSTLAASLAGSATLKAFAMAKENPYRNNIGIQLYTLRDQLSDDIEATMKAVADAGFKQVELYGFSDAKSNVGFTNTMIGAAKDNGLAVNSSHFAWEAVTNPSDNASPSFEAILEDANNQGLSHLVVPYLHDHERGSLDDYKQLAEGFNDAAEKARVAGIQLSYHNHNFEFTPQENNKSGYDIFIDEFSEEMKFEIDVFWAKLGGWEPVDLMRKLKGRVSQLHLKDLKSGMPIPSYDTGVPEDAFKELGNGIIPMEPIMEIASEIGVEHCHVEQDQSPHPIESVQQSMTYLGSL